MTRCRAERTADVASPAAGAFVRQERRIMSLSEAIPWEGRGVVAGRWQRGKEGGGSL